MELDTKFFTSKDRERFVEVDFKTFDEWYWVPKFIKASLEEGKN